MRVKKSGKSKEYVRLNLSSLINALNKTFKTYIAPYGYGDDLCVVEGVKAQKKIRNHPVDVLLTCQDASDEVFESFENMRTISSGHVEWFLMVAVSCGLIEGANFIVDLQD